MAVIDFKALEDMIIGTLEVRKDAIETLQDILNDFPFSNYGQTVYDALVKRYKNGGSEELCMTYVDIPNAIWKKRFLESWSYAISNLNVLRREVLQYKQIVNLHDLFKEGFIRTNKQEPVTDLIEKFHQITENEGIENISLNRETQAFMNYIDNRAGKPPEFITGFHRFDKEVYLQRDSLFIIAGHTTHGKTAFALTITMNMARQGIKILIISIDMSMVRLMSRIVQMETSFRIDGFSLQNLTSLQHDVIRATAESIKKLPIRIVDNINDLASVDREMQRFQPDVVIIDYIQLMKHATKENVTKAQEVSTIIETLKYLGKRRKAVMIVISQVSRESGRRRPVLTDLKESSSLEQQATTIAFVYRPFCMKKTDDKSEADISIDKNQDGDTGRIKLIFNIDRLRFGEKDEYAND